MLNKIGRFNVGHFTSQHPLSPFGQRIVQIGQKAALGAILKHKALGNPIYYKKEGKLIKELTDGTQFVVETSVDGIQTIRTL